MGNTQRSISEILDIMAQTDPMCGHCNFECGSEERCLHLDIVAHLGHLESLVEAKKLIDDGAFGKCPSCGTVFNSELISEYEIEHCHLCGQKLMTQGVGNI